MSAGVAVTTYRRPKRLRRCITSVLETVPEATFVFVTADEESKDTVKVLCETLGSADTEQVTTRGVRTRYVTHERYGIARNKNTALQAMLDAGCDHLFLLEDDVQPKSEGWVELHIQAAREADQHGLQRSPNNAEWRERFSHEAQPPVQTRVATVRFTPWQSATMLYATREAVEHVGLMDERFKVWGYEHCEWQDRFLAAGLVGPQGWPFIDHEHQESFLADMRGPSSVDYEANTREFQRQKEFNSQLAQKLRSNHKRRYGNLSGAAKAAMRVRADESARKALARNPFGFRNDPIQRVTLDPSGFTMTRDGKVVK